MKFHQWSFTPLRAASRGVCVANSGVFGGRDSDGW